MSLRYEQMTVYQTYSNSPHTLTPPPPFSLSLRKDAERGVEARRPTNMMGRREAEIVPHVEHVPHNSKL